jgi:hypothetical protein
MDFDADIAEPQTDRLGVGVESDSTGEFVSDGNDFRDHEWSVRWLWRKK